MLKDSILDSSSIIYAPTSRQPVTLPRMPQGDIAPGTLVTLPDYPTGDISSEEGDFEFGIGDLDGNVEYFDQGDLEMGAPKRKVIKAGKLANKIATGTASSSEKQAAKQLLSSKPAVGSAVAKAASVKSLARNQDVHFESVKGGRILASDLGVDARLRPTEVEALKTAIHLSTPFSPKVFNFSSGTLDVVTSLNSVVGTSTIYYAGILITLAASTLNISQGAVITIIRHFGLIAGVSQQTSMTIELDSGVAAVEILVLNGLMVTGRPRFWAPIIAGAASVDGNTDIDITGLPANYAATARFLQPGDHQVEKFLRFL